MNDGQYFLLDELNALSCRRQVGSDMLYGVDKK